MNKITKITLVGAIIAASINAWATNTTDTATCASAVGIKEADQVQFLTSATNCSTNNPLDQSFVARTSKNTAAALDLSKGVGTVGVAAGSPKGSGKYYAVGTSSTSTNLGELTDNTGLAYITTTNMKTKAASAAS